MVGRKGFLTVLVKLQKMMIVSPLEANPNNVKGYKEAISSLEEVKLFLNNRGCT